MLSWFKFNNLGLVLGANLKFYTSVAKRLKLKARKFFKLIPTFVETTREILVGEGFPSSRLPPFLIGLKCISFILITRILQKTSSILISVLFLPKKSKALYGGHLVIADTFFRNCRCPLQTDFTVIQ